MELISGSRLKTSDWIALIALGALTLMAFARPGVGWREALLVTTIFAIGGWLLRGVSGNGALAGGMAAFVIYAAGGWRMFAVLFVVFVLTLLATTTGRARKQELGLAEASAGRSASQVAANLVVAVGAMVALPATIAAVVTVAALAEAAADTVSSEVGEAFGDRTYLITKLRQTSPGTNGGVSLTGTLGGVAAAAVTAGAGSLAIRIEDAVLAASAGTVGMLLDSVLGATLENKGYIGNDVVNLLGTGSAAAIAYALCRF